MRLRLSFLLFVLAGTSFSQSTNFAEGPQYLAPNVDPLYLRSISTPSVSFSPGLYDPYVNGTELTPSHVSSALAGTAENVYLGEVYWGPHPPSEILAHRIQTPSLTAEQAAANYYGTAALAANALSVPISVPIEQVLPPSSIEISSMAVPANLPPSIVNPGVTGTGDMQSLLNRGYGISLGDLAAKWKAQRGTARRSLTNEDLERK